MDVRRLFARLAGMVTRGSVELLDEATPLANAQVTVHEGEVEDELEVVQQEGFWVSPPAGAQVIVLAINGSSSHRVAILPQVPGNRPTDADPGCGGVYTDGEWRVYVDADGVVHVGAKEGAEFVALAEKTDAEINRIWKVLTTWTPVAQDGGAALKTAAATASSGVQSVAATKARAT